MMKRATGPAGWLVWVAAVAAAGCAQRGPGPLYLWEAFPKQQYEVLLRDGVNTSEQVSALEAHAERARGANAQLPPGFRAHLGMLQLSVGNAQRARELWLLEKAAFPEAGAYMDQLLKRLDGPTGTTATAGSPA